MPGIVGIITLGPSGKAKQDLSRMIAAVQHESFYSSGTLVDEQLGVYAGWTAIRGSFSDEMPLRDPSKATDILFSGEDYGDRFAESVQRRARHQGEPSSSYLLETFRDDEQFFENLNGMFHGLILDRRSETATLFNDRYGMHRLYVHESDGVFYFANEAKAILAARPDLRRPDLRGIGEFIACSCVLENRTIFKGIQVLPAASKWMFRRGSCAEKTTYFNPSQWEEQTPLDAEAYYEELRGALTSRLSRYFAGDQRLGIAITGGLDTRVILANHPMPAGSLPSYTFGGPIRESYDVRVGRKIAELLQQPYQVLETGSEFLDQFGAYAERSIYLTEGTVDVYRASDLYLSTKVRAIAPAKIVGTYGSEIVRQAVMFKPMPPLPGLFTNDMMSHVQDASVTYGELRKQHPVTFAAFRQSPWYHHGILALEQTQLTVRSPFMDNAFVRAVYRAPRGSASDYDVRLRLIRDGDVRLSRIASDRGVIERENLLAKGRRAFREFTFKAEYAYDYGMPQWVTRVDHTFSKLHLERLFLGRHKLLHYRLWYRDRLAQYVREMLLDSRTLGRPYLQKNVVVSIVDGHLSGTRNYTSIIHKLLTLELMHRQFFD